MNKQKLLVGFAVILCLLFVVFQFNDMEVLSCVSRSLIVPVITLLYFQTVKGKSLYFSLFLILFSISDLTSIISDYIPPNIDYFWGNGLYIVGYTFLLLEIVKSLNLKYIINNYSMHLIVLGALNIYIIYVLLKIVYPIVNLSFEFFVELLYNIVILLLLSVSLLNYFYKDDRKSLLLFLGSLCIVFSEVIQVANAYLDISQKNLLIFSSTMLAILAFYFLYSQANLKNKQVNAMT